MAFAISNTQASFTLSVYFIAFAIGVFVWGWLADRLGRRFSMLAGLAVYGSGGVVALWVDSYSGLLVARVLTAFGAAVGSVITQTILRDCYRGRQLTQQFAKVSLVVAMGPAAGLLLGSLLVGLGGYLAVFVSLVMFAIGLLSLSARTLPETLPPGTQPTQIKTLIRLMASDANIWLHALLVALFNLMLFGYYGLAPFDFERLGYGSEIFGLSGLVLALGNLLGFAINRTCLNRGVTANVLMLISSALALLAGCAVHWLSNSLWFLAPMVVVMAAFGMAIPNVLAQALNNYRSDVGAASAIFGLTYYLMLSLGLGLAANSQNLGQMIAVSGLASVAIAGLLLRQTDCKQAAVVS